MDWNLLWLMCAYAGVGLGVLWAGFLVIDLLTPGSLGEHVTRYQNPGAAIIAGSTFVSLGLIVAFAIFFTGGGWHELDDVAIFGLAGIALQAISFVLLDVLTPGKLGDICLERTSGSKPAWVVAAMQFAVALVISASLT